MWSVKFETGGKQVFQSTGKTSRKEAIEVAKGKIKAAMEGRFDVLKQSQARQTVAVKPVAHMRELLRVYKEEIPKRAKIEPATLTRNISALRVMVRAALDRDVFALSSADVCTANVVKAYKEADEEANVTSVNSTLTQARAVFSRQALELYRDRGLRLPATLEAFLKVPKFRNDRDVSYRPIDRAVLEAIEADALTQPKAVRLIYVLARIVGMRGREIVWARRSWIEQWTQGGAEAPWRMAIIRRPAEGFKKPKGKERWVPLTKATCNLIIQLADEAERESASADGSAPISPSGYLLPGGTKTDRINLVKREAAAWIRTFLPDRVKGLHELRKQAGSEIATRDGIMAARDWLGHASVTTTEAHYATLLSPLRPL